ncbi:MAG TPA: TldD/PmbA family protein [Thermoleophilaceae bacterium]
MSGANGELLEDTARRAVEAAVSAGADQAEAWAEEAVTRQIRVYEESVESLKDAGSRGIGIRVFTGNRSGYAYGTDLSDEGIAELARTAGENARVADEDEFAGLPERPGAAEVSGLYSPELANWNTERKVQLAVEVERTARANPQVSQVEDVVYADAEGRIALANSAGFVSSFQSSSAWSYVSAFAGEGADLMTGLGVGLARDPSGLDPEAIGREGAERAAALVGARQPESRHCPVVFDAFVAASFIGFIGGMLSADAVQRGRSLFADKEGEEIASGELRLVDDGTDAEGPDSSPFDGEGSPRRRTPLIEDGRLLTFLFDARTARKAGRETTGNAGRGSYRTPPSVSTSNLILDAGSGGSLEDLARTVGDGLYVTDVAGLHSGVNPVSGTFSVGATGRLIENGELGTPVREMTIASDLVSMLKAVEAVGSTTRWVPFGGSVKAVPLLLREMSVSGS